MTSCSRAASNAGTASHGRRYDRPRRRQLLAFAIAACACWLSVSADAQAATGENLYWITGDNIARATSGGTGVDGWFLHGLDVPNALAVGQTSSDPYIYWSEALGDIGRANIDGSNVIDPMLDAASTDTENIVAIATDDQYLYWESDSDGACPGGYGIGRANLDGTDANPGYMCVAYRPAGGLAVSGGYIYWSWTNPAGARGIGRAPADDPLVDLFGLPVGEMFFTLSSNSWCVMPPNGILVTSNTTSSLAVAGNSIYWTGNDNIWRVGTDGSGPSCFLRYYGDAVTGPPGSVVISRTNAVATDGDNVYWTEANAFVEIPSWQLSTTYTLGIAAIGGSTSGVPSSIATLGSEIGAANEFEALAVGPGTDAGLTQPPQTGSTGPAAPSAPPGPSSASGEPGSDGTPPGQTKPPLPATHSPA